MYLPWVHRHKKEWKEITSIGPSQLNEPGDWDNINGLQWNLEQHISNLPLWFQYQENNLLDAMKLSYFWVRLFQQIFSGIWYSFSAIWPAKQVPGAWWGYWKLKWMGRSWICRFFSLMHRKLWSVRCWLLSFYMLVFHLGARKFEPNSLKCDLTKSMHPTTA